MKEPIEYKVDHEWETYDGDRLIAKTVMLSPVHLSKEEEERSQKVPKGPALADNSSEFDLWVQQI